MSIIKTKIPKIWALPLEFSRDSFALNVETNTQRVSYKNTANNIYCVMFGKLNLVLSYCYSKQVQGERVKILSLDVIP